MRRNCSIKVLYVFLLLIISTVNVKALKLDFTSCLNKTFEETIVLDNNNNQFSIFKNEAPEVIVNDSLEVFDILDFSFISDDESVVFVNEQGIITKVNTGETKVHVLYGEEDYTYNIIVNENENEKQVKDEEELEKIIVKDFSIINASLDLENKVGEELEFTGVSESPVFNIVEYWNLDNSNLQFANDCSSLECVDNYVLSDMTYRYSVKFKINEDYIDKYILPDSNEKDVIITINGTKYDSNWQIFEDGILFYDILDKEIREDVKSVKNGDVLMTNGLLEEHEVTMFQNYQLKLNDNLNIPNYKLVWETSDENILTVNKDGLITAYNEGEAIVTVKYNEFSDKAKITVKKNGEALFGFITVNEEVYNEDEMKNVLIDANMNVGVVSNKDNFLMNDIVWHSTNDDVLSILSDGRINFKKSGVATIYGTKGMYETNKFTFKVFVVSKDYIKELYPRYDTLLNIKFISGSEVYDDIIWSVSDSNIASVNESGILTSKHPGVVKVTATTKFDKSINYTFDIKVLSKDKNDFSISFDKFNRYTVSNSNGSVTLGMTEITNENLDLKLEDNQELIGLYDIYYINGSNKTFDSPKYTVRIPVDVSLDYENVEVLYVKDGEVLERIKATFTSNYVEFVTTHFSNYAIIGTLKEKEIVGEISTAVSTSVNSPRRNPKTHDSVNKYYFVMLVFIISLVLALCSFFKRKAE